jgi:tetratricopeptide (TPR) repeat protein
LAAGDAAAALAALAAAGATSPDAVPLRFLTGLAAWYLGDAAQALGLVQRCFDDQPMNGTIAEVLASLYAQSGDLVESLYYGKLATALGPDQSLHALLPPSFPSFGRAFLQIQEKPLLAQARLQLAAGHLAPAIDRARQHVDVAPGDAEGRFFYAETLLRAGLAGRAVEALRPSVSGGALPAATASLMARALAAVGEVAEARRWHEQACALAPDDPAIAAAKLADARWLGDDDRTAAAAATQWATRFLKPKRPRRWPPTRDRLVIGYLVSRFADRRDAAAVAAVARAHARPGTQIIAYGFGAQSWIENSALAGAFDQWRDIGNLDPATLARMIAVDGVDVAIDVAGFAAPVQLQALARVETAIRVAWLTPPAGLENVVYDAAIAPSSRRTAGGGIDFWQPSCGAYPLAEAISRRSRASTAPATRFGSDALLAEIGGETVALWRKLLAAAPGAALLLRANDMARGPNINRLIERFGAELAARIDVIEAASAPEFYAEIDVALAPLAGLSPGMAANAVSSGVPVVALHGSAAADLLEDLGLRDGIAPDVESYIARAQGLAASSPQVAAASTSQHAHGTARDIAEAVERSARAALAKAAA